MRAILKENTAKHISLERSINEEFEKKKGIARFFKIPQKKIAKMTAKNDHASFNQINELIGYLNSADVCEIWPEHSFDVVKPKTGFLKFINISTLAIFNSMCIAYSLLLELDKLTKKKRVRISKNAQTVLMTDPLRLTLCSYFANALGFDTHGHFRGCLRFSFVELKKPAIHIFFQNLHLLTFPTTYSLPCFPLKWRAYEFFSGRTPAKVRSNLKVLHVCH